MLTVIFGECYFLGMIDYRDSTGASADPDAEFTTIDGMRLYATNNMYSSDVASIIAAALNQTSSCDGAQTTCDEGLFDLYLSLNKKCSQSVAVVVRHSAGVTLRSAAIGIERGASSQLNYAQ